MYTIRCNKEQLQLISTACEYLWRHCIWQEKFKAMILENWRDEKEKIKDWYSLTDIRKQVEHQKAIERKEAWEDIWCNVHWYDTFKMWKYDLIEILKCDSKQWQTK